MRLNNNFSYEMETFDSETREKQLTKMNREGGRKEANKMENVFRRRRRRLLAPISFDRAMRSPSILRMVVGESDTSVFPAFCFTSSSCRRRRPWPWRYLAPSSSCGQRIKFNLFSFPILLIFDSLIY